MPELTRSIRKEIRGKSRALLAFGKTKQETYDELVEEYKYSNEVAEVVRYTPTPEKWKKYRGWNTAYMIFLIVLFLFSMLSPSFGLVLLGVVLGVVIDKNFRLYYLSSFAGGLGILASTGLALYEIGTNTTNAILTIVITVPIGAIMIIAGVYLPRVITPKYKEKREKFLDARGRERIKVVHVFE
jgi:hypothetical protein